MPTQEFCKSEDGRAEILIIYESQSDLVTSIYPPIYLYEYERFISPLWVKYGQRQGSGGELEFWVDFTPLPAGYTFDDFYWRDRIDGKIRYEDIDLPSGSNERRVYYFDNQVVCDTILQPQYYVENYGFCYTLEDYEYYLNPFFTENINIVVTGASPPFPSITAAYIYDTSIYLAYDSKTNLGPYRYDVSCGSCAQGTFPVNDGTKDICVPYEDIINWSKQQRQRLKQIAKDVNSQ